jgi:hypothetical protein
MYQYKHGAIRNTHTHAVERERERERERGRASERERERGLGEVVGAGRTQEGEGQGCRRAKRWDDALGGLDVPLGAGHDRLDDGAAVFREQVHLQVERER